MKTCIRVGYQQCKAQKGQDSPAGLKKQWDLVTDCEGCLKPTGLWNCEAISRNIQEGDLGHFCLEKNDDFGLGHTFSSTGEGIERQLEM